MLFIAIILQAGSFALFGVMNSVWGWYVLSIPLAIGGVFITVIGGPILIERWFSKGKGLALGILSAIGGLLGVFAQPIVGALISQFGWRTAYLITGLGVMIIVAPSILLLIRNFPKDKNTKAYGDLSDDSNENEHQQVVEGIDYSIAKKHQLSSCWDYFSLLLLQFQVLLCMSQHISLTMVKKLVLQVQ